MGQQDTRVDMVHPLGDYILPETVDDPVKSLRSSLRLLKIAPQAVVMPVLAHTYLAPLCHFLHLAKCPPAFTLFLSGGTGTLKTTLAALEMAHYGKGWDNKNLPANFKSTKNALMDAAFLCKDVPLLVDDFHPTSNMRDSYEMNEKVHTLATAWGDYAGRSRMRADRAIEAARPPRGIGIITGEDAPSITESGNARFYTVQISKGDIKVDGNLNALQKDGREGVLAEAMLSYILFLQSRDQGVLVRQLYEDFTAYRQDAGEKLTGAHGRMPEAVASLWIGLRWMLKCMREYDAISEEELDDLWAQGKQAIISNAMVQRDELRQEKPTLMYLEAVSQLVSSGQAHLQPISSPYKSDRVIIGYYDEKHVYLIAHTAFSAVETLLRMQGRKFPVASNTTQKRLKEEGYLYLRSDNRGTTETKHVTWKGKPERFLILCRAALMKIDCDPAAGLPVNTYGTDAPQDEEIA